VFGFARRVDGEQHALLELLASPVCPVCARANGVARRALEGVLRDGVNDVETRNDWRARGGLCAEHWRVWRQLESPPLSTAILAEDLLRTYRERGRAAPQRCPGCDARQRAEGHALRALRTLPLTRLDAALGDGAGLLCLTHLEALPQGAVRERFESRLNDLLAHLHEQIRTSDHRFASERSGPHADAWLRALRVFGADV